MNASEFIIQNIKEFHKNHPQTSIKYERDDSSNTHFVEVTPLNFYKTNKIYIDWEISFQYEFISKYINENIGFLSSDALVKLEKIDFELKSEIASISISTSQAYNMVKQENISEIKAKYFQLKEPISTSNQVNRVNTALSLQFTNLPNYGTLNIALAEFPENPALVNSEDIYIAMAA